MGTLGAERIEPDRFDEVRLADDAEVEIGALAGRAPQEQADPIALGAPGRGPQLPLGAVDHNPQRPLGGVRDSDADAERRHLDADGPAPRAPGSQPA